MSTKQIGTLCSRKQHFIKFLNNIKLGNNFALKGFTLITRNIIMACYTAYLASGETLLCKTIKSSTIKRYLDAAAELSTHAQMINPCLDIMGNQSVYITNILKELKRWESMPNRKEPVTKQMIEYIIKKGQTCITKILTIYIYIYTALADWLIVGQQAGFRRKEWAQDRTHLLKYKHIERYIDGSSAAFIWMIFNLELKVTSVSRIFPYEI